MGELVADYCLKRLREWGVHRIYGYPGDGINAFLGALDRADGDPDFIQARHEEMAAFMACGHAKFARPDALGVCMATSGPGAIHLLNGLYDAKLDHVPVVAIVGQQKRSSLGSHYQQEVDLQVLFKDVSEYVQVCMVPEQARHLLDRACRIALDRRGVCTIIVPNDVAELDAVSSPPRTHGSVYSSVGYTRPRVLPQESDIQHAAEILNEGEKVAMLVGQGARGAAEELERVADLLGAGVAKALLGKDVLARRPPVRDGSDRAAGDDSELRHDGGLRHAAHGRHELPVRGVPARKRGRRAASDRHQGRHDRHPLPGRRAADRRREGDAARAGAAPGAQGRPRLARGDREEGHRVVGHRRAPRDDGRGSDEPAAGRPRALAGAARGRDCHRRLRFLDQLVRPPAEAPPGHLASLSGTLATMGPGVPYAIAAKFALSRRPVICFVGDGAMQMNGMNELITIAKY